MPDGIQPNARVRAIVYGHVQGVGYRAFAQSTALSLDLNGFVRNLPDGTVEVVAEGARPTLDKFINELEKGPIFGRVRNIDVEWHEYKGDLVGFAIR
ncbi:MAG TPA: acylphosphatase [Firmicutes bacterium]|nr:acylphosphatase [Bacillota bacterium]